MEPTETVHPTSVEEIFREKRQYRTPFKVDLCAWCPQTELIAVASKKGDIVLKRKCWKKCWRVSVHDQFDPLIESDADSPRTIECIEWNEKGNILSVGMSDGTLFHILSDSGVIFWRKTLSRPNEMPISITKLYWAQLNDLAPGIASGLIITKGFNKATLEGYDNCPWVRGLIEVEHIFRSSLQGRHLFAFRDDMKISVLSGGVLTISVIDLNLSFSPLDLIPFAVYDISFDPQTCNFLVALSTYGPKPIVAKNKICTEPEKGSGEKMLHTHIASFRMFTPEREMFSVLTCYVNFYNRWIHCVKSLEKIMKDWQTQYQIFSNRLIPSAKHLNLGACFTSFCIYGNGTPLGEAYNEKQIQTNISGFVDFIYNHYDLMLNGLSGDFTAAVRNCCYFMEEVATVLDSNGEEHHGKRLREASITFQKCVSVTVQACVANANDLLQFVKWLTVIPVTDRMANTKRKQSLPQLAKMDLFHVLKFLLEIFVDEKLFAEKISQNVFNIDKVLEMEKRLEDEGFYPEHDSPLTAEQVSEILKTRLQKPSERRKSSTRNAEETPIREKTNVFRRPEKGVHAWKERLDQLSGSCMETTEISSALLDRLGLSSEENRNLPSIKKQLENIKAIILDMDKIFEAHWPCNEVKFLCEIVSDSNHRGFTNFTMKKLTPEVGAGNEQMEKFVKQHGQFGGLLIAGHDGKSAIYRTISFSTFHLTKICINVREGEYFKQEFSENIPPIEGEINKSLGQLVAINDIFLEDGFGFLYAIATLKLASDVPPVRRIIRWHPLKAQVTMHDISFRTDQLETIFLKPKSSDFGSFFSDESTRVTLFSIK